MNKSEAVSQELLTASTKDDTVVDENVLVVYLDADAEVVTTEEETPIAESNAETTITASNGETYSIIGTINIPKINVNYAIMPETSVELLKISPCKFWGPNPNEVGNFCIAGHNYRNSRFFSKVPTLEVGDTIEITDLTERTLVYEVYDIYTVDPNDKSCTSQLTNGKKEVTLITCTNDSSQRVIVKATCITEE
jgi:LPXTG-site transpeptidase (sortase) family protein